MPRHGENIYKRRAGRYEGRYVVGKNLNGKDPVRIYLWLPIYESIASISESFGEDAEGYAGHARGRA